MQVNPRRTGANFMRILAGTAVFVAPPAIGQTMQAAQKGSAEESGIQDIVVTAQRKKSALQDTPLAVTALDGSQLAERQITDVQALAQSLPSVTINPTLGNGRIALRGIGLDTTQTGGEGRVAYHLDGVYISRPSATLGTMFDIERVEAVRGPQGTLYGRNATAGAINVVTADPSDEMGGYARLTVGNYDLFRGEAALNLPFSAATSLRVAGQITRRGGYGRNVTTGEDINDAKTESGRLTLIQKLGPGWDLRLSADYHREHDANYAFYYLGAGNPLIVPLAQRNGAVVADERRDTTANFQQHNRRVFYGGSMTISGELGATNLTSVTGYRHSDTSFSADADGTNFAAGVSNQFERAHQFSEELRFSGDFMRGDWVGGLYYFRERIDGRNEFSPLNRLVTTGPDTQVQGFYGGGRLDTEAFAVFGEVRFEVAARLSLVAGGRYSYESKRAREARVTDFVTPYSPSNVFVPRARTDQSADWRSFTPRVSIEFRPSSNALAYATYSQGFKSGGFALGALQAPVEPETLDNYELGLKADFLDRRLRTNLSIFYYDYKNLQVSKIVSGGILLVNAAKARLKGAEVEIIAQPSGGLQFDLTAALLDSEYIDFQTADPARPTLGVIDLNGNQLSQAAPYTVNLGAQYRFESGIGSFTLRGEGICAGRVYFNPFNRKELSQPANSRFNAFVNFVSADDRWTGSLFVRNIGDVDTLSFAYTTNPLFGSPIIGSYQDPRTVGIQIGRKF